MHQSERILIIGGTRGTGLLIGKRLLEQGYRVRALGRHPHRAATRLGSAAEVVAGDVTKSETLSGAVRDVANVIFTAGVRPGFARERRIVATEYQGVLNALAAARNQGFDGRFLYMTSIGVTRASLSAALLNLIKGNTLRWRKRVEDEIGASGVDYTIIRAGFLLNSRGGSRAIDVSQEPHPLAPRYRIARADVAETFVEALEHSGSSRTTFEIVWGRGPRQASWDQLFRGLKADA